MKYLRYLVIALIIIIPCVIAILIYNDKITQNSPIYYKQGVDFYNKGDYQNAYYNFSKIKWISPLYPVALYKQAKSAQKVGDYLTASLKYNLFLEKSPNSVFADSARYNLARSYFYLKRYQEAKEQFLVLKTNRLNVPSSEDYYLGLIYKQEDKEQAANYFRNYIKESLKSDSGDKLYLLPCSEELATLNINLTDDDKKILGEAYYINKKYQKALEYFSKLPISSYWDYMVIVNHYAGNKAIARKLIESGLDIYSSIADEERLHQIYDIYTSYMSGQKLKNWTQMYKIVQLKSLKGEDYVMYKLAGLLPREKAINLYKEIEQKYPDSNYAPESLWNEFWYEYSIKRNYESAQELAHKHLKRYKNVNSTTKMIFWLAKVQMKLNKNLEAHNILSKLASKYPDDYYGLRAESIINKRNNFWTTNHLNQIIYKDKNEFPISLSNLDIKDIKLINTLFELGDYEIWLDANFNNKIVESWFETKKGKKSRSILLARDMIEEMDIKPPFISSAYKLAYPLYWVDEINLAGKKFALDPFLIMALIREESYFNENARSASNALGLMQLMPGTANYIITKFAIKVPQKYDMMNPRINIFLGCTYLKYLEERFNDNDLYVIAAYNGGEGSVNKWIKKSHADNDEFIENIPYDETHNYVKKIFRSYYLYKKIYG